MVCRTLHTLAPLIVPLLPRAYQRVCVDLRTLTEVGLFGYHQVPPPHRLWIWATDLEQTRKDLPLT
ncbi:hypothetical protein ACTMTI_35835 [Nonomuraea sp. H19]|uniref:hypothetical protein n=1 Tax=Nonomuraea sp. H19 TaxID=3452206 RepID=UPI003F89EBF6